MAELAALFTVYRGSAADSVFYRKKRSLWVEAGQSSWLVPTWTPLWVGQRDGTEGRTASMDETEGKDIGREGAGADVTEGGWVLQGLGRILWGWLEVEAVKLLGGKAGLAGHQQDLTQRSGCSPVKELLAALWKITTFLCLAPQHPEHLSGAPQELFPPEPLINATIITWRPLPVSPTDHSDTSEPSALALLTPGLSSSDMRNLGDHMQRKP